MRWTDFIIPVVVCGILLYGIFHKVNVFDTFVQGAKEGISVSMGILPALIALMTCVGMLKASGAIDAFTALLEPLASKVMIPKEVIPLALLRPISGSGALVVFEDILKNYGPDSLIGRVASVLQGSTETTFYTIAVYYSAVKVTKTRHTLGCALTADGVGFIMSAVTVWFFFSFLS